MEISDNDLNEFRRLYRKEFGKWISREKAREMATRLLDLCEQLYQHGVKSDQKKNGPTEV